MSDEKYCVYVWGSDPMGPWDSAVYGPYDSYEEAETASEQFLKKAEEEYADCPPNEWRCGADVVDLYPAMSGDEMLTGIESDTDKLDQVEEILEKEGKELLPTEH